MRNYLSRLPAVMAVLGLVFMLPASAAEVAGTFTFVSGDVRVKSGSSERAVKQGDVVREGETIISGAAGEAQLRMVDEAQVSVRRGTELRVDEYKYKGGGASDKGLLSLVKGTFRALTGLIVRNNRDGFTMRTTVATIGIRGTGNITNHDPSTNVTINHTVTGSHSVSSVADDGKIINTIVTSPGITVQVVRNQPAQQIPTPPSILQASTKDPKEQKGEGKKDAKGEPRSDSMQKAETETRETTAEAPTQQAPAATPPPAATSGLVTAVTSDCGPACQQLLLANLRTQLEGFYLQAQSALAGAQNSVTLAQGSATAAQTSATAAQTSATAAQTSATNAAAVTAVDLAALDAKIASAQQLVTVAPSIQPQVTAAQASRTTAFNAAGLGNTSSSLVSAQTAAQTAATSAAGQVTVANNAVTSAQSAVTAAQTAAAATQSAYSTAQATYNAAIAALDAGNATLALQLLDQLNAEAAAVASAAGGAVTAASNAAAAAQTASTAASAASSAASTAASQATSATTAQNTANTNVASGLASADQAINIALQNIQNVAIAATNSATSAANAAASAQTAQTTVNTASTQIGAIGTVDTTPATSAISSATSLIGDASTGVTKAVNDANALSLASAQTTASANATTAAGLKTTADTQVTSATAVHNANANVTNGVGGTDFRDSTAIAAKTAMDSAKTALDGANTQVQTAKTTVDTQATALATAQGTATTNLSNANTALGSANTSLTTANTENGKITTAQGVVATQLTAVNTAVSNALAAAGSGTTTLDPNPIQANSPVASACGSAKACADLTTQYVNAAVAAAAGSPDQSNATNNALTTQGRAANFDQQAAAANSAAQAAATTAQAQVPIAQAAATAATTAVTSAATAAGTGASGAQGLANTANTAATSAQTASTTGTTALSTSNTQLATAQSSATTVAEQAIIAQYSNPIIVSSNRFTSVGRASKPVTGGSERVQHYAVQKANTNFVLSGEKSLVESRVTDSIDTDRNGTFNPSATGDLKVVGGTPSEISVTSSNTAGAENYMAIGRVTGGQIQANGSPVVDLGARSFHWMIGYEPPPGYVSPTKLTGVTTYTKIANTSPTDAAGNVGTLNSATLSADFTNQTVAAGVNVSIANKQLAATGSNISLGVAGPGTPQFGGAFNTVNCTGTGCPSGSWGGGVTGSLTGALADGAGFVYDLHPTAAAGTPYSDLVQGAVAFQASTPPALVPQPPANFVTAYLYGTGNISATIFEASGTSYTLDGSNRPTAIADDPNQDPASETISGGTAGGAGTFTTAGGTTVNYGRWDGPGVTVARVDDFGGTGNRSVAGSYNWMTAPPVSPFYKTETLTGTASYTFQGGNVTSQSGAAGTISGSSTFSADFAKQSVAFDIQATTPDGSWQGTGAGIALDGGSFWASTNGGPHRNMSVLFNSSSTGTYGTVDGIFMGAGADALGLGFSFGESGGKGAAGVAGFGGSAQSLGSHVIGIVAAGKMGAPLTGAGASTGQPALATLDSELAHSVGTVAVAASRVTRDGAGQVVKADAMVPIASPAGCTSACSGVDELLAVVSVRDSSFPLDSPPSPGGTTPGTALTNTGSDAATGISWGRYVGFVSYTDRIGAATGNPAVSSGAFDARTSNWHGIWSSASSSAPVLPSSGTVTYTSVGGTFASDSTGAVATTPTTATLSANFTSQTVNASVNATVGANAWAATASNIPIVNRTYFEAMKVGGTGNLNVTVNGSATNTAGTLQGVFVGNHTTGTAGGVMMGYSLNQGGAAGTTMQGVSAFKKP